jgi:hypothetical protein
MHAIKKNKTKQIINIYRDDLLCVETYALYTILKLHIIYKFHLFVEQ